MRIAVAKTAGLNIHFQVRIMYAYNAPFSR